jgi:hypothetical protein
MANEITIVEEYGLSPMYTIADGTGLEQGILVKRTSPRTVAAQTALNDPVAGVLRVEKIALSGTTQATVVNWGRIKFTVSGAITVGDALISSETANTLCKAPNIATVSGLNIVAIAEETSTNGQTAFAWLQPYVVKGN